MASAIFRISELRTHAKHLHYYVRHITETHIRILPLCFPICHHVQYICMSPCMPSTWHTLMCFLLQEQCREIKSAETVMPLLHFAVFSLGKFFVYTVEPLYSGHHWDPAGCPYREVSLIHRLICMWFRRQTVSSLEIEVSFIRSVHYREVPCTAVREVATFE